MSESKKCTNCKKIKLITEYKINKHTKNLNNTCLICNKTRKNCYENKKKQSIIHNPPFVGSIEPIDLKLKNHRKEDTLYNRQFNLDKAWVIENLEKQNNKCWYDELDMLTASNLKYDPNLYSIDRLDNKIGHLKDNCVLCHVGCNMKRGREGHLKFMMKSGFVIKEKHLSIGPPINFPDSYIPQGVLADVLFVLNN